jgi:hypothetical protein
MIASGRAEADTGRVEGSCEGSKVTRFGMKEEGEVG